MRYPLGQPVRLSTTVRDLTGALATPPAISLTLQAPDGTQASYAAPVADSTGEYHQDLMSADLTQTGHYQYSWSPTDAVADPAYGDLDVFDPLGVSVLSLDDAKAMLRITDTAHDTELASWIATVESSLEQMTGGPLVNKSITERVEATDGFTALVLRQRPLVSLQSVVNVGSGLAVDFNDMTDLDVNASIVRRRLGWPFFGPFYQYLPIFTVTYTAGWGTAVPAAFASAARIIVKHLWDVERGVTPAPMLAGDETSMVPGFGFAIPNRAAELLAGSQDGIPFRMEAFV